MTPTLAATVPVLFHRRSLLVGFFILLALLLAGCDAQRNRSDALETNWSRGLSIGSANLREPGGIVVEPGTEDIHFVWAKRGVSSIDVHYTRLNREGGVRISNQLGTRLFLPRRLRLLRTPAGEIHIFTQAQPDKDGLSGVYHLPLTSGGILSRLPTLVTPPDVPVEAYDAVLRPDGSVSVVWEAAREAGGGLHYGRFDISSAESGLSDIIQINADGRGPSTQVDVDGTVHLIWFENQDLGGREIFYQDYGQGYGGEIGPSQGTIVASHGGSDRMVYSQPVLGYDDDHLYAFWSREIVGGFGAGTAATIYTSFPKNNPAASFTHEVLLPDAPVVTGTPQQSNLAYIPLSSSISGLRSSYVVFPAPVSSDAVELPLLLAAKSSYRMQEEIQPVMAVFSDGALVGYEPLARTDHFSYFPVGDRDENGRVYALWLDLRGGGTYNAFFASTDPVWKATFLKSTSQDIAGDMAGEISFGMLAAVALLPITVIILVIPYVWIAILVLLNRAEDLQKRSGRIQFVVSVIIYYVAKTAAFAPLFGDPTLLISFPQPYATILTYLLPAIIFAISFTAFWVYTRRADLPGMIAGFFVFSITDIILTVLVYGPTLYQ